MGDLSALQHCSDLPPCRIMAYQAFFTSLRPSGGYARHDHFILNCVVYPASTCISVDVAIGRRPAAWSSQADGWTLRPQYAAADVGLVRLTALPY